MSEQEDPLAECTECVELMDLISDYLEGDLTRERREELMAHIHSCDDCARLVWSLKRVVRCCHEETRTEVPTVVHQRLWRVIVREITIAEDPQDA